MKEIYRYIDKEGGVNEYQFTDGICDGFFRKEQEYKGRPITDDWLSNLPATWFKKISLALRSKGDGI